jgi:hypothetical protein
MKVAIRFAFAARREGQFLRRLKHVVAKRRRTPQHREDEEPAKIYSSYAASNAAPVKVFVLHGLWPGIESGAAMKRFPVFLSKAPSLS